MASPSFFAPAVSRETLTTAKKGSIRLAKASDATEITQLRISSYKDAVDFGYNNLAELEWQPNHRNEFVMVACNQHGKIIASIQAIILPNKQFAENYLQKELPLAETDYPILYLNRAATDPSYRRAGIHTVIRYHLLEIAERLGIQSVVGVVFKKASRVGLMEKMGYEFIPFEGFEVLTINPENPAILAKLSQEKFGKAFMFIEDLCHTIMKEYPWAGDKFGNLPTLTSELVSTPGLSM